MLLALALVLSLHSGMLFSSSVAGERWNASVTRTAAEAAPRWREEDEHPPLSPRAAIRAGRRALGRVADDADKWTLHKVSLQPAWEFDMWVYVVEFDQPFPSGVAGSRPLEPMRIPVLMDGTAGALVRQRAR